MKYICLLSKLEIGSSIHIKFDENLLDSIICDFNKIIETNNNYANSLGTKKSQAQRLLRLDEVNISLIKIIFINQVKRKC